MQHELNYERRLRAAALFHHGGKSIPDLAHEYRTNRASVADATREFPKDDNTLRAYQQMIGGS